jgi:DNA-binding transcriptional regulator PaaX
MENSPTSVKEVLELLERGSQLAATDLTPQTGPTLAPALPRRFRDIERRRLQQIVTRLFQQGSVDARREGTGWEVGITSRGRGHLQRLRLLDLEIRRQDPWDGYWRMIAFEIPEAQRSQRESLRRHLQRLGFYPLQSSLYVIPWPCFDELVEIVRMLHLESSVTLMEGAIGRDSRLKYHFKLR